jgi:hypothetical protein
VRGEKKAAVGAEDVCRADSRREQAMIGTRATASRVRSDTVERSEAATRKMAG